MARFILLILSAWSLVLGTVNGQAVCTAATTCDACVRAHKDCAWCTRPALGHSRCQLLLAHTGSSGCDAADIVAPRSTISVGGSGSVNSSSSRVEVDLTKSKSQKLSISLRQGASTTFDVKIIRRDDFPVDLYYLLDGSSSMSLTLRLLRRNSLNTFTALQALSDKRRIGFGLFTDKPKAPYFNQRLDGSLYQTDPNVPCGATSGAFVLTTECNPNPNAFTHIVSLTDNTTKFNTTIYGVKLATKSSADQRKSQFDALLQATVCEKILGWDHYPRGDSIRLILLVTDGEYHIPGEGLLGGILKKNNGECQVNPVTLQYEGSTTQDYPSPSQVLSKLEEYESLAVMAVAKSPQTDNPQPYYQVLVDQFRGRASTAIISRTGSDKLFVDTVLDIARRASEQASVRLSGNRDGITFTATAKCPSGQPVNPGEPLERCDMMRNQSEATFTVTLTATDCTKLAGANRKLRLTFSPAYGAVDIDFNALCSCPCTSQMEYASEKCSSQGTLECGQCNCSSKYIGASCQCLKNTAGAVSDCQAPGADNGLVCSGRGSCIVNDQCRFGCGFCEASHGKYCQCTDSGCALAKNGLPCGGPGQGRCTCDPLSCDNCTCSCFGDYTADENCNFCNPSNLPCRDNPNSPICSNNGKCSCGTCNCTGSWTGATCSACAPGDVCVSAACSRAEPCIYAPPECLGNTSCFMCDDSNVIVSSPVEGAGCVNYYCPNITFLETSPGSTFAFDDPLNPPSFVTNGDLCQATVDNCRRLFYSAVNSQDELVGLAVVKLNQADDCTVAYNSLPVIVGINAGLIGLVVGILLIWKLATFCLDRREYRRFLEAQESTKWEMEGNPLFKKPTQRFVNPEFNG